MDIFKKFRQRKSKISEFKFRAPRNKTVFTCNHIIECSSPILFVTHDENDDWQFLCGGDEHELEDGRIISLQNAVELDQTLNDLFEMPRGFGATREEKRESWNPFKIPEEWK